MPYRVSQQFRSKTVKESKEAYEIFRTKKEAVEQATKAERRSKLSKYKHVKFWKPLIEKVK